MLARAVDLHARQRQRLIQQSRRACDARIGGAEALAAALQVLDQVGDLRQRAALAEQPGAGVDVRRSQQQELRAIEQFLRIVAPAFGDGRCLAHRLGDGIQRRCAAGEFRDGEIIAAPVRPAPAAAAACTRRGRQRAEHAVDVGDDVFGGDALGEHLPRLRVLPAKDRPDLGRDLARAVKRLLEAGRYVDRRVAPERARYLGVRIQDRVPELLQRADDLGIQCGVRRAPLAPTEQAALPNLGQGILPAYAFSAEIYRAVSTVELVLRAEELAAADLVYGKRRREHCADRR